MLVPGAGFKAAGLLFIALGAVGALLPLLPTTPFLLLAAACFARSSPKWHAWLLSSPAFGRTIRDWHHRRCVSWKTKCVALGSILIFGGYAVGFGLENGYLRLAGGLPLAFGFYFVARLQVCPGAREAAAEEDV